MSLEQYIAKERKSLPPPAPKSKAVVESELAAVPPCFDCNICLDFANDPVITLCGHLYCWPCIYKWFHIQSASLASDEPPQCPVCKADVTHSTVVPLYGRGQTAPKPELESTNLGVIIPPRPTACGADIIMPTSNTGQKLPYRNPYQIYQYEEEEEELNSTREENMPVGGFSRVLGMFWEMVYARVFGNSDSLVAFPNLYMHGSSSSNPRFRRQDIQNKKSLNRISIFLFFCFILCPFLF